ncbi:MAG: DUF5662 family protein [Cellvibrionales bacterium]|nr:DUF5662 family protein [Cellvibrionales bacterium]
MTYFNRFFIFTTLIVLQHVAVGLGPAPISPTGDSQIKNDDNFTQKLREYRQKIINEFQSKHKEKITPANRERMLGYFIDSVIEDFKDDKSKAYQEAIDMHKMDFTNHQDLVRDKGYHELAWLNFECALKHFPENPHLKAFNEMHKGTQEGIDLMKQIMGNLAEHDADKMKDELSIKYAKICRADSAKQLFNKDTCGEHLDFNEVIKKIGAGGAAKKHVENNRHHPEFWIILQKAMPPTFVFELFVDGASAATRHLDPTDTLKNANKKSKSKPNWGRLTDDDSSWSELPGKQDVYDALHALMLAAEDHYGAETEVGQVMEKIQEDKMKTKEKLKIYCDGSP